MARGFPHPFGQGGKSVGHLQEQIPGAFQVAPRGSDRNPQFSAANALFPLVA